MDTLRQESLRTFVIFTFLIGILLLIACVWSLDAGTRPGEHLVTSFPLYAWAACAILLTGAGISWRMTEEAWLKGSRVLCATVALALAVTLINLRHPDAVIALLLPVLFAVFLFDWREVCVWIGISAGGALTINHFLFPGQPFALVYLVPVGAVVAISGLLLLILYNWVSALEWYQDKFKTASQNEQIIRDNEIVLKRLLKNMKEYQAHLKQSNEILGIARNQAEEALQVKQLFMQNVSHELRTPLNLIIGFSETMVNAPDAYGEVHWTPELRGDIDCIYQSTKHLKALIDDVLDIAALEGKKYQIFTVEIDLNTVVQEAVLLTEDTFTAKGLSVKNFLNPEPLMVRADPLRIKQVVLNLLSNALKYTESGGVMIHTRPVGRKAQVSVQDTGIGIAREDLGKVFESFYQVDKSSNRKDTGTGLGLSISKHLVELHGGQIHVESQPGAGTTVFFTIPLLTAQKS